MDFLQGYSDGLGSNSDTTARRVVPPDVIEYHLYVDGLEGLPIAEALASLEVVRASCDEYVAKHAGDYIWQREPFRLQLWLPAEHAQFDPDERHVRLPHLYGRTAFGDNLEDEWFITWLLMDLTRRFPDLTVKVTDSDGQFLLIEAADFLPGWLDPDNAEHRVWLRGGQVHLVPRALPGVPASAMPMKLSVGQGLALVQAAGHNTLPSTRLQAALQKRLAGMPSEALEHNTHRAKCILPPACAAVLAHAPHLVAPAIEAFYLRDHIDLRAANKMARFMPTADADASSSSQSATPRWAVQSVRFTRCLYAQLSQQNFHAPKHFRLPAHIMAPGDPRRKAVELGVKLACGLEMLYQNQVRKQKPAAAAAGADAGAGEGATAGPAIVSEADRDWVAFRASLARRGYFGDLLPGTAERKAKEDSAVRAFLGFRAQRAEKDRAEATARAAGEAESKSGKPKSRRKQLDDPDPFAAPSHPDAVRVIDSVLGPLPAAVVAAGPVPASDAFSGALPAGTMHLDDLTESKAWSSLPADDDESWLVVTPEQLEKLLQERAGTLGFKEPGHTSAQPHTGNGRASDKESKTEAKRRGVGAKPETEAESLDIVQSLVAKVSSFVQASSGHDGVEVEPRRAAAPRATDGPNSAQRRAASQGQSRARSQAAADDDRDVSIDVNKLMRLLQVGPSATSSAVAASTAVLPIAVEGSTQRRPVRADPDTLLAADARATAAGTAGATQAGAGAGSFNAELRRQLRETSRSGRRAGEADIALPASDSEDDEHEHGEEGRRTGGRSKARGPVTGAGMRYAKDIDGYGFDSGPDSDDEAEPQPRAGGGDRGNNHGDSEPEDGDEDGGAAADLDDQDDLLGEDDYDDGDDDDDDDELDQDIEDFRSQRFTLPRYMARMDQELRHSGVGREFERDSAAAGDAGPSSGAGAAGDEELGPVNLSLNLAKNLLASHSAAAETGQPGPVANILSQYGFVLPDDADARMALRAESKPKNGPVGIEDA